MSDLRHPNITQFMGVCFLPNCQLPMLLMERLDGSLDDLLETVPNIPLVLKRSILEDVSRGLLYLHKHTPQIIHRDLTAKNVLLTSSLVAKITDFGNARIVNLQPGQLARTMSQLPGTQIYMPPEALSANACYGPSLDIFSFGHLALFTLNQVGFILQNHAPGGSHTINPCKHSSFIQWKDGRGGASPLNICLKLKYFFCLKILPKTFQRHQAFSDKHVRVYKSS